MNEQPSVLDIAIVGGGVAGLTSAIYALRRGLKVVLFEKLVIGGQTALIDKIENFPSYESVNGYQLVSDIYEQANKLGLITKYAEVVSVKSNGAYNYTVQTTDGDYISKTVIIATGATHKTISAFGDKYNGKGVHYCATCDGMFYKGKDVAVIGGTSIALSDALYLSQLAKSVTVVVPASKLFGQEVVMKALDKDNIKFLFSTKATGIIDNDGKVVGIQLLNSVTGKTEELKVDGIFVAIGTTPLTQFVEGLVKTNDGRIVVDAKMATSAPGIYSAGDVVDGNLKQIVVACANGATAAESCAEYINSLR